MRHFMCVSNECDLKKCLYIERERRLYIERERRLKTLLVFTVKP